MALGNHMITSIRNFSMSVIVIEFSDLAVLEHQKIFLGDSLKTFLSKLGFRTAWPSCDATKVMEAKANFYAEYVQFKEFIHLGQNKKILPFPFKSISMYQFLI